MSGRLDNVTSSLSWGAVSESKKIQEASHSAMDSAVGMVNHVAFGAIDSHFTPNSEGQYDTAGLSVDGVRDRVIPAVDAYIAAIQTHIDKLPTPVKERNDAVKGDEIQGAVGSFVDSVRDHLTDVVSHLKKFNERLNEVVASYISADANIGAGVRAQASQVSDAIDRYGE